MMKFASKYSQLRVVLEPEVITVTPQGHTRVLRSPRVVQFHFGQFVAKTADVAKELLHHRGYNRTFFGPFSIEEVQEGIYEEALAKMEGPKGSGHKVDVDTLAKQVAAKAKISIKGEPLPPDPNIEQTVRLKVEDIIKQQERRDAESEENG